jgi:hypothetical protein
MSRPAVGSGCQPAPTGWLGKRRQVLTRRPLPPRTPIGMASPSRSIDRPPVPPSPPPLGEISELSRVVEARNSLEGNPGRPAQAPSDARTMRAWHWRAQGYGERTAGTSQRVIRSEHPIPGHEPLHRRFDRSGS